MSSISGPGKQVLERFIEGANAQYRTAGLSEYQMRVDRHGNVSVPNAPKAELKQPSGSAASTGSSASQAATGATDVQRSGAAPKMTDLQKSGTNAFKLVWQPVAGATQYGIWQDGTLMGHVKDPSFAGTVAAGTSGTIQVDAVTAGGKRTELTKGVKVTQGSDGLSFAAA